MTLAPCIEEYVRHRRSLGVCFHGEQVRLRAFLKSAGDVALPAISAESVRRYIDGNGPVTQAWFARFYTVAAFYRFTIARQYTDHAPLPPRPPKPPAEFIPYIYSETDMRALLEAVDARHEEDWLVRPQTVHGARLSSPHRGGPRMWRADAQPAIGGDPCARHLHRRALS